MTTIATMTPRSITSIHELSESHFAMRKLISNNLALIESAFQDQVAVFRADVINMFQRNNLEGNHTWLMFRSFPNENTENDNWWESAETLVTMDVASDRSKIEPPLIRFYENIVCPGCMITRDITVDHFGDAQYFVDAVDAFDQSQHGRRHSDKTYSAAFEQEDGELYFINKSPYTPIVEVDAKIAGCEITALPFGMFDQSVDREHALDQARLIFNSIQYASPFSKGSY
jgi:hypothetical protein